MSCFVLIHGGAHGAWCWDRVVPYLNEETCVERVIAVDLLDSVQAHDSSKATDNTTLEDYVAVVTRTISELDLQEIILVGHSLAGITIPLVAAEARDKIKKVVYIATTNPLPGQSVSQQMEEWSTPWVHKVGAREMFCSDLDEESSEWLLSNLRKEPGQVFSKKIRLCGVPEDISSTYILLEQDKALSPEFQLAQAENARAHKLIRFDSGHSPFASRPEALAKHLLGYV